MSIDLLKTNQTEGGLTTNGNTDCIIEEAIHGNIEVQNSCNYIILPT